MDVYLIVLNNGVDEQCCMVDEETMNWVKSPRPEFQFCHEALPPNLLQVYAENDDGWDDEPVTEAYVTSGSWENDRALFCRSIPEHYDETSDLETILEHFQQAGDTIVGAYVGSIY